jgi:acyl-CoA reductase-like NAD-dependent aldehyde dehydrogenase
MAFQASIFTEDLRTAFDAAERLAASAVMVNDHTAFRTDWMPLPAAASPATVPAEFPGLCGK